jgi:SAM-dependent MidA family methyltransferase
LLATSGASLPERIGGVLFSNELLDALPTHAVVMTDNGLREIFVDLDARTPAVRFVEKTGELSTPRLAEYLSRAGAIMYPGWRAEVNLAAEDWMKSAALSLQRGFLVMVDYGHEETELYNGSHATGTLTSFRNHSTPSNVLDDPGQADITAHVDLTAITRAASDAGLDVIAQLDQTYFVLGLAEFDAMPLPKRLALKTLLLPGGLGSTHKVLIFGKGVGAPTLKGCSYRVRMT